MPRTPMTDIDALMAETQPEIYVTLIAERAKVAALQSDVDTLERIARKMAAHYRAAAKAKKGK